MSGGNHLRKSGIQKHLDEIKHQGVEYLLLSMASTYQRARGWSLAAATDIQHQ